MHGLAPAGALHARPRCQHSGACRASAACAIRGRGAATGGTVLAAERLAFERIVAIGATAVQPLPQAREQVRRQEKRSPPFVLAHVHVFVPAHGSKQCRIGAEDDVAEGDRA
jgi:hypothetical protein